MSSAQFFLLPADPDALQQLIDAAQRELHRREVADSPEVTEARARVRYWRNYCAVYGQRHAGDLADAEAKLTELLKG